MTKLILQYIMYCTYLVIGQTNCAKSRGQPHIPLPIVFMTMQPGGIQQTTPAKRQARHRDANKERVFVPVWIVLVVSFWRLALPRLVLWWFILNIILFLRRFTFRLGFNHSSLWLCFWLLLLYLLFDPIVFGGTSAVDWRTSIFVVLLLVVVVIITCVRRQYIF